VDRFNSKVTEGWELGQASSTNSELKLTCGKTGFFLGCLGLNDLLEKSNF
jgi:hypothetical protein